MKTVPFNCAEVRDLHIAVQTGLTAIQHGMNPDVDVLGMPLVQRLDRYCEHLAMYENVKPSHRERLSMSMKASTIFTAVRNAMMAHFGLDGDQHNIRMTLTSEQLMYGEVYSD